MTASNSATSPRTSTKILRPNLLVQEVREVAHERQIGLDPALRLRSLHLDRHDLPAQQHGPVHLADARGPERYRIEALENLLHRRREFPLDYRLRHPGGIGLTVSCSFWSSASTPSGRMSERVDSSWPNLTNVGPRSSSVRRSLTPKLGREELLQALVLPPVPPDVEDEPEPVADQHPAYLGEAPEGAR